MPRKVNLRWLPASTPAPSDCVVGQKNGEAVLFTISELAEGAAGPTGPTGATGPTGPKGDKGVATMLRQPPFITQPPS